MKRGGYESICQQSSRPDNVLPSKSTPSWPEAYSPESYSWNGEDAYYKAVLGSEDQAYYLNCFLKFRVEDGFCFTWNWAAFWGTFFWCVYRKMWMNSIKYIFFNLALLVIVVLLKIQIAWYFFLIFFVPGLMGNYFYYNWCAGKIDNVKSVHEEPEAQISALSKLGGTSNIIFTFLILVTFVFFNMFILTMKK